MLAQYPVTAILEARGERIHPASAELANESHHITREAAGHELDVFEAWRRMDEILITNFMVFHDLVEHRARRALPVAPRPRDLRRESRGRGRAAVRRRSSGDPRVDAGALRLHGLCHGFDSGAVTDRDALRAELGFADDETVCFAAVGGSGVGEDLLLLAIEAHAESHESVPGLRTIAVTGPRIDPDGLPRSPGLEVRGFVDDLYRLLVACDVAVVQGGLTTCMELTAARRPFLYFPLRRHCEQRVHVRHRLDRYGAGRCIEFETTTPTTLAGAIEEESRRQVDYRPVETDGAARAAALIADVIR